MRRHLSILPIVLLLFFHATVLHAQGVQWQEQRTQRFTILYPAGAQAIAGQYAQFVDNIYDETSAFWSFRPEPPIVLRIYPTMELYYQANPLAAQLRGVIAHANTGRREISVAIPQTAGQTGEEIRNNVRHELTHIIAADLSGGRLTTSWQEGIAQYAEHPSPQLELKMKLMRQVVAEQRLRTWAQLNQPGATYSDPQVGYPESLTIVAFLIHRNGIERFRAFVEAMKDASGYRSALESAYGVPPETLEREWRAQLPDFINTGYRSPGGANNSPGPVDLTALEQMVIGGNYDGAVGKLQPMMEGIQAGGDARALQRAQSLLARAKAGQQASRLTAEARDALVQGNYQAANQTGLAARQQFQSLGQSAQAAAAEEYAALAARGIEAEEQVKTAGELLRRLQLRPARQLLLGAFTTFGELGDETRAAQTRDVLALIARGEQILAAACLASGGALVAWSSRRRYKERPMALPLT
jgi:hypothetical protein